MTSIRVFRCQGVVAHYSVPMNSIDGQNIANPSDLEATVTGSEGHVTLVPGVNGNAVQFDGTLGHITMATRGFGFDCFGDFDKCSAGIN